MFLRFLRFFNNKNGVESNQIKPEDSYVSEEKSESKLAPDLPAYVYVLGNAEITFGSSTIDAIAAKFYYKRIP